MDAIKFYCTNKRVLNALFLYDHLVKKHKSKFILGGSLSLMLQGVIQQRDVHDLDLAFNKFVKFQKTKVIEGSDCIRQSFYVDTCKRSDTIKDIQLVPVDLFIRPDAVYKEVKIEVYYHDQRVLLLEWLPLQSLGQIMEAKLKFLHRGYWKHLDDITAYVEYLKEKNRMYDVYQGLCKEDKKDDDGCINRFAPSPLSGRLKDNDGGVGDPVTDNDNENEEDPFIDDYNTPVTCKNEKIPSGGLK